MELPKYVQKDIQILENAELKVDKYGYCRTDYSKMSEKLFKIAQRYPQKYLEAILEYLGYFNDGDIELDEEDYRDEIFYIGEYCFIEAMNSASMYDDNVQRQAKFIELGIIDGWFDSPRSFKERYQPQYQTKIKEIL